MKTWLQWSVVVALIAMIGAIVGALIFGHVAAGLVSGVGAIFGGAAAAWLFGKPGWDGAAIALGGAVLSTALGAGIIGGLVEGLGGAVDAASMVLQQLALQWPVGLAWLAMMGGVHLVAGVLRNSVSRIETEC